MLPANALLQCSWYRCQTLYKSSAAFLQQYQLSRCKSGSSSSIREALIVFYFIQNSETPNLILDAPIFSYASSSTLYTGQWLVTLSADLTDLGGPVLPTWVSTLLQACTWWRRSAVRYHQLLVWTWTAALMLVRDTRCAPSDLIGYNILCLTNRYWVCQTSSRTWWN